MPPRARPAGRTRSACAALVGDGLGVRAAEVLVCQTGLIGIPLPMAPIETGIPVLVEARAAGHDAGRRAALAIMTTDTICKEVTVEGAGFTVGGMAKGAAMLAPNMATMLAVLTTDARCGSSDLDGALRRAVRGHVQPDDRGRMHIDQRHRAGAGERGQRHPGDQRRPGRRAGRGVRGAGRDDGGRRRGCEQGGARDRHGGGVGRRGASRRPQGGGVRSRQVLAQRGGPLLGPGGERAWIGRGGIRRRPGRGRLRRRGGVPGGRRRPARRVGRAPAPAGTAIEMRCDLGLGAGSGAVLTTDLGHGYIDENRTTS